MRLCWGSRSTTTARSSQDNSPCARRSTSWSSPQPVPGSLAPARQAAAACAVPRALAQVFPTSFRPSRRSGSTRARDLRSKPRSNQTVAPRRRPPPPPALSARALRLPCPRPFPCSPLPRLHSRPPVPAPARRCHRRRRRCPAAPAPVGGRSAAACHGGFGRSPGPSRARHSAACSPCVPRMTRRGIPSRTSPCACSAPRRRP